MKEIYPWNIAEELANGRKVYAVLMVDGDAVLKNANELTMKEWVENDCGKKITFLMVSEDE